MIPRFPMDSTFLLLTLPSGLVLLALLRHSWTTRGRGPTLSFLGAVAAYGVSRSLVIRWISRERLGSPHPYLMNRPVVSFYGVSVQELVGWALAVLVAFFLCDRLWRRLGRTPTPHRMAGLAALVMAALCLAVETAAISASWWTWTLALPVGVLRVPPVALLDWGFVAFDFLLPYLLLATPAPIVVRAVGAALFPLHMLGHTLLTPLPEPLPLAGNDFVHVGIVAYVLLRAVGETGVPAVPETAERPRLPIPALAALLVAAAAALAPLAQAGDSVGLLSSAPLALLALLSLPGRRWRRFPVIRPGLARALIGLAAVLVLVLVRIPASRRQTTFVRELTRGVSLLNTQDVAGAEQAFRSALGWRPDQAGGRTLLAVALLRQGRREEARRELESALAAHPTARDPLILLATFDLQDGRLAQASRRAALGRRVFPERPEFVYQAAFAEGRVGPGRPAALEAIEVARAGGAEPLRALAGLAQSFGDQATVQACAPEPHPPND